MMFGWKGKETLESGGYVVFIHQTSDGQEVNGFWSNPKSEEFERNTGFRKRVEPLRIDGHCTRYEYLNQMMVQYWEIMEWQEPYLIYAYGEATEGLPEGFEEVRYIIPIDGKYRAVNDKDELLAIVPESSAIYLHTRCGIPYKNPKNNLNQG